MPKLSNLRNDAAVGDKFISVGRPEYFSVGETVMITDGENSQTTRLEREQGMGFFLADPVAHAFPAGSIVRA